MDFSSECDGSFLRITGPTGGSPPTPTLTSAWSVALCPAEMRAWWYIAGLRAGEHKSAHPFLHLAWQGDSFSCGSSQHGRQEMIRHQPSSRLPRGMLLRAGGGRPPGMETFRCPLYRWEPTSVTTWKEKREGGEVSERGHPSHVLLCWWELQRRGDKSISSQ